MALRIARSGAAQPAVRAHTAHTHGRVGRKPCVVIATRRRAATKGIPMKILLPIDGSPQALEAVRYAVRLVRDGLNAEFVLVNAQAAPNLYEMAMAHDAEVIDQVRSAAGADLLRPAEALLEAAGLSFESEVVDGDPARVLVETIERSWAPMVPAAASVRCSVRCPARC
jgi:nucleotide-binding universal stress UspA family protein